MPEIEHPLHRSGGEWILGVLFCTALLALAGSALFAHRAFFQASEQVSLFHTFRTLAQ